MPADKFQGYVFEEFSAETFNIDAAAARSGDHADVLHSLEPGSVDVRLKSGDEYSLKSYATAEKSATEQARLNLETRKPLYDNQHRMVPTEQLENAKETASRRAARDQQNRPDVSESYAKTQEKLTDVIENNEGVRSKPVTRKELDKIAEEAKKSEFKAEEHDITPETAIKTRYALEQAGKAGLTAAAITLALQYGPVIFEAIRYLIQTGEIQTDKLISGSKNAITAAGESFLSGAVAFSMTLAINEGKISFLKSASPTIVGTLVAVTIQIFKDSIQVARGKMQPRELGASLIRTTIIAGTTIAATSAIMGAIGNSAAPIVGYVIGTLVGCTVSILYGVGQKGFISFCVDSGFTCFGLVEQDYALPEEVLHELGIDTIEIPYVDVPRIQVETVSCALEPERIDFERIGYSMLKRGIIGVNKIGYVSQPGY